MAVNNHITGSRVTLSFRINSIPKIVRSETINLQEIADEVVDQVNGEDAGRPDIVTDIWKVAIKAYVAELDILDAFLADAANQNAGLAELTKDVTARFALSNGTIVQYALTQCARSPIAIDVGGRKARVMMDYAFRARYCKKVGPT